MNPSTRRRFLAAVAVVMSLSVGGCLTLSPSVTTDVSGSPAFEEISVSEPWASGSVQASVTLTPNATTSEGVGQVNVIGPEGTVFSTTTLEAGQRSATILLPTNTNATVVAINPVNGTTVDTQTVQTGGNRIF